MKLEGAYIRNILHICAKEKDTEITPLKVNIPYYQRPYQWGEKEITNLINDFEKNAELNKEDKSYFVGAVVLVSDAKRSRVPDLIDGQQRVTTVFLLNYIKYLLLMSKVDVLLEQHSVLKIQKELDKFVHCYNMLVGTKRGKELETLSRDAERELAKWLDKQDGKIIDDYRERYKEVVGLPESKDLSHIDSYLMEWKKTAARAITKEEFTIGYSRKSFNKKLAEALANVMIVFSSDYTPEIRNAYKGEDKVINQYIEAMKWIYQALTKVKKVQEKENL